MFCSYQAFKAVSIETAHMLNICISDSKSVKNPYYRTPPNTTQPSLHSTHVLARKPPQYGARSMTSTHDTTGKRLSLTKEKSGHSPGAFCERRWCNQGSMKDRCSRVMVRFFHSQEKNDGRMNTDISSEKREKMKPSNDRERA